MNKLKVSVAMCTYNGAKYIREQMDSILQQTISVDEIVICDDGSTDDTISIIKEISRHSNIPIRLYQNENNLGFVRNFSKTISLCQYDIIFLSDHDDIWLPNKVQVIMDAFSEHPEIDLVSSDAYLINEQGLSWSNESLFEVTHLDQFPIYQKKNLIPEFFAVSGRITGAAVAFRNKSPYNEFLQYQGRFHYHDETITFMSVVSDKYLPIPEKLIKYRLSSTQACGLMRTYFDRDIHTPFEFASNFHSLPLNKKWEERICFIEERINYKRHPYKILMNLCKYKTFYRNYASEFIRADIRRSARGILHKLHLLKIT